MGESRGPKSPIFDPLKWSHKYQMSVITAQKRPKINQNHI